MSIVESFSKSEDIFNQVRDILVYIISVDKNEITREADIKQDLGADSLDGVELLMEIEERFGIDVLDEEAEKIKTVDDICNCIERLLK